MKVWKFLKILKQDIDFYVEYMVFLVSENEKLIFQTIKNRK